jgi:hypothetical protein
MYQEGQEGGGGGEGLPLSSSSSSASSSSSSSSSRQSPLSLQTPITVGEGGRVVLRDDPNRGAGLARYRQNMHAYRHLEGAQLAKIFGNENKAVQFKPEWNSAETARRWLARQKATKIGAKIYKNWGVEELDMDKDPETPDNVIVYSDVDGDIIKSVDGFYFVPPTKKQYLRGFYQNVPYREDRRAINADKTLKKRYKEYFTKYQTPADWQAHTIGTFQAKDRSNTLFSKIRKWLDTYIRSKGFTIYTPKNNPTGKVLLTHYMGILQKLTSAIQNIFMQQFAVTKGVLQQNQIDSFGKEDKDLKKYIKQNRVEFETFINTNKNFNALPNQLDYDYIILNLVKICSETAVTDQSQYGITIDTRSEPWVVIDPFVDHFVEKRTQYRQTAQQKYRDTDFQYEHMAPEQINDSIARRLMDVYSRGGKNVPGTWGDVSFKKKGPQ